MQSSQAARPGTSLSGEARGVAIVPGLRPDAWPLPNPGPPSWQELRVSGGWWRLPSVCLEGPQPSQGSVSHQSPGHPPAGPLQSEKETQSHPRARAEARTPIKFLGQWLWEEPPILDPWATGVCHLTSEMADDSGLGCSRPHTGCLCHCFCRWAFCT